MNLRKIAVILVSLLLLGVVLLGIFLFTFNVDRLRPAIQEHLSQATGKTVSLGKISMTWQGAFALKLSQVTVYSGPETQAEPLLTLDSMDGVLDFWPLLQRKISIGSIFIRKPELKFVMTRGGVLKGFEPQGVPPAPPPDFSRSGTPSKKQTSVTPAVLSFLVQQVVVEDGSISYRDETQAVPTEWIVRDIDLKIRDVSFNQRMPIQAQAALLSDKQNISLDGAAIFSAQDSRFMLERMRLTADLDQIRPEYLASALGATVASTNLDGSLVIELIKPINLSAFNLAELTAQISLADGKFSAPGGVASLDRINLNARVSDAAVDVQDFNARFAGGALAGSGKLSNLVGQPSGFFRMTLKDIALDQFAPPGGPSQPRLEGQSSVSFEGSFEGKAWPQISRNLRGQGELNIRRGVIRNFNMLREIFHRLSVLPRLVEKLQAELPPGYEEKLNAEDTALNPVDIPFSVSGGVLQIPKALVTTDTFGLLGSGSIVLDGRLQARAMISIEPSLSQAMIKSVQELYYLTDPEGRIGIPINLTGVLPRVQIVPDLPYVASRLAVAKTREWVGGLMQKKSDAQDPNTPPDQTNRQPQGTPLGNILGQFLGTQQEENHATQQTP